MATFPVTTPANQPEASSLHANAALAAGLTNTVPLDRLSSLEQSVGNMLQVLPPQGGAQGAALSYSTVRKSVTAIADNTATNVLTITVPNVLAAALVRVTIVGIAGTGGAIGSGEDVTAVSYNIAVCRTVGVAMGATVSTAFGSAAAVVAGAGTMTTVGAITLVGEGVSATNTGQFKATINQSADTTANICLVYAECYNYLAGGVTIS